MKLQQLRFLTAVVQNDLNLTVAAARLSATQPAISKQLKLLEQELGLRIFARRDRALIRLTPPGQRIVEHALRVLRAVQNIKDVSDEFEHPQRGTLSIGTMHTQARYVLPPVIKRFRERYPQVQFNLHQGTSEQIAEMGKFGRIRFAIVTGSAELFPDFVLLPCYRWHRRIIVPRQHPLAGVREPALEQLSEYPLVSYVSGSRGPSSLSAVFGQAGLRPTIALTAGDCDVIKSYVRLGLGVGIIAGMALDRTRDVDLVSIDASHLLPVDTTWIGFLREALTRRYLHDFLQYLAPHLTRRLVDCAVGAETQEEVAALFAREPLPLL